MRMDIADRPGLSIVGLMKSVVFFAVAFACIAPMLHLWRIGVVNGGGTTGLIYVVLFEAIAIPLAWIGLSFCLIRRGARRDVLITSLLLCSVTVALGIACWMLVTYTIPAYGNPLDPPESRVGITSMVVHVTVVLAMAAAALFLTLRLRRGNVAASSPLLVESREHPVAIKDVRQASDEIRSR